jgi:hypothetical protein
MTTVEPRHPGGDLLVTMRRAAQDVFDRRSIRDLDTTLTDLVSAAVEMVPGAVGGGLSRTERGAARSSHATDEVIGRLDERQSELNQGPCIVAADDPPEDGAVVAVDLAGADADRWPGFAPAAVELGYRSMLATHLGTRPGGPRSALNLYAHEPDAFDAEARVTAGLFAVQAATVLYGADEAQMLGRAVDSRDEIGQAKGILMERFTLDADEAFEMLVSSSQETNVKLVTVARWLISEAEQRRRARSTASGSGV